MAPCPPKPKIVQSQISYGAISPARRLGFKTRIQDYFTCGVVIVKIPLWSLTRVGSSGIDIAFQKPLVLLFFDVAPVAAKYPVSPYIGQLRVHTPGPEMVQCGRAVRVICLNIAHPFTVPTLVAKAASQFGPKPPPMSLWFVARDSQGVIDPFLGAIPSVSSQIIRLRTTVNQSHGSNPILRQIGHPRTQVISHYCVETFALSVDMPAGQQILIYQPSQLLHTIFFIPGTEIFLPQPP